jgi:hypothetical protein
MDSLLVGAFGISVLVVIHQKGQSIPHYQLRQLKL